MPQAVSVKPKKRVWLRAFAVAFVLFLLLVAGLLIWAGRHPGIGVARKLLKGLEEKPTRELPKVNATPEKARAFEAR